MWRGLRENATESDRDLLASLVPLLQIHRPASQFKTRGSRARNLGTDVVWRHGGTPGRSRRTEPGRTSRPAAAPRAPPPLAAGGHLRRAGPRPGVTARV